MEKYKTISSEIIFENKWWQYIKDQYILPTGQISDYHYVHTHGSTFIIPKKNHNTFYMIRQYRYLNQKFSIEFPGGGCIKGLSKIENAKKELKEEVGLEAKNLLKIGYFNPYHGVTDEICEVYLATELTFLQQEPDDSEEIEVLELNKKQIIDLIKKGEIWDGMTLSSWCIYNYYELKSR